MIDDWLTCLPGIKREANTGRAFLLFSGIIFLCLHGNEINAPTTLWH